MQQKQIKIGKEIVSSNLKTEIFTRFFNEKEMKSIWESYKSARLRGKGAVEPTDAQFKIAELRKTMSVKDIENKLKLPKHKIVYAVQKVALYQFFNS